MLKRAKERTADSLRDIRFVPDFQAAALASVLIEWGGTRVLCSVSGVDNIPPWMRAQNVPGGWLTCEYRMLPGSTRERTQREGTSGPGGRTHEIQRLIGRSLRAVLDLKQIGKRTLYVDCDVIDADGGTRCASITGACVALEMALRRIFGRGELQAWPLSGRVAAVSVGIVKGETLLDLDYQEDNGAEVDMNLVMTADGRFVEVQGTAEGAPFGPAALQQMLTVGQQGLGKICALQDKILTQLFPGSRG